MPAFGGAAAGVDLGVSGAARGGERLQGSVELSAGRLRCTWWESWVRVSPSGARISAAWSCSASGSPVALSECPAGGSDGVVPERERGVQVLGADLVLAVEQRVDQREADRVRFSAGGDVAGKPVVRLGELRVGVPPQLPRVRGRA